MRIDNSAPLKAVYIVNENTLSEMRFLITEKNDLMSLSVFTNVPTHITANITSLMDGTKGVITEATEISKRFPNPLKGSDTGITQTVRMACKHFLTGQFIQIL